jgi:transcriptional regulator with XRE-family HTH domain
MHTVRVRPHPAKGVIAAQGRHLYEVAAAVGINPSQFGGILNRRCPVPDALPRRLADLLGVPESVLFDERDAEVAGV